MDQPKDIEMDELLDEKMGGTLPLAALESLPAEIMDWLLERLCSRDFSWAIR